LLRSLLAYLRDEPKVWSVRVPSVAEEKADQLLRKRSYPIDVGSGRCEASVYEAYYHGTIEPMAEHE
jgi:hypothetical protein